MELLKDFRVFHPVLMGRMILQILDCRSFIKSQLMQGYGEGLIPEWFVDLCFWLLELKGV